MEKFEFIKLMLNHRTLSVNDKKRLVLLATRELEREKTSDVSDNEESDKVKKSKDKPAIHKPKDTADFLSLFNDPNGFKFLTHDFDPDSDFDYDKLINLTRDVFNKATSRKTKKYSIPKSLFALMNCFLNGGEEEDGTPKKWRDCDGNYHIHNYSSKEWIEWAKTNPQVHPITNEKIKSTILKFRSTIRLVKPALQEIVKRQASKHSDLVIQTEKLDKADFYTYVFYLEEGIRRILDDMSRYSSKTPNVLISFNRVYQDDYSLRVIKITQIGSVSTSLEDVLYKFKEKGGGAFNEIKKLFAGYCNWSVESLWDGKAKRWNILDDNNRDEIEDIEQATVNGFTHVLTYYSR